MIYSGNELSPKAQKNRRESYGREKAYWPTLYRLGGELVLARPRKFRIVTRDCENFFAALARYLDFFSDLVAKELPTFTFSATQKVNGQKQPGAWKAPLTMENYQAVRQMCAHGKEIFLNVSGGVETWLKETRLPAKAGSPLAQDLWKMRVSLS